MGYADKPGRSSLTGTGIGESTMGPELIAAGIGGLANLAGGLFGLKAEAKKRERDSKMEGLKAQLEAGNQAAQTLQQGTQGAFNQLMQNYQGVFRR